jgi:putative redox protein
MAIVTASVLSTDQKMAFKGEVRSFSPIQLDYYKPFGEDCAPGPMEMVLVSLGTCTCSGVALILRKMGRTVDSVQARLAGDRTETHPTVFKQIKIDLEVISPDATEAELESCIAKAETVICPVYIMLSKSVDIQVNPILKSSQSQECHA